MALYFSPYLIDDTPPSYYTNESISELLDQEQQVGNIVFDMQRNVIGVVKSIDSDGIYASYIDRTNTKYIATTRDLISCDKIFVRGGLYLHRGLQIVFKVGYLHKEFRLYSVGTLDELSGKPAMGALGSFTVLNSMVKATSYEPLLIVYDEPHKLPKWAL